MHHFHIMQLRCIKCAFFYHATYEIITSFKLDVLKINIEQYSHTNLLFVIKYLEKYSTCNGTKYYSLS
jgi:hypothetical protein